MAVNCVRRHVEPVRDAVQHVAAQELAVDVDELRVRTDRAGAGHGFDSKSAGTAALQLRSIAGPAVGRNREKGRVFAATTTSDLTDSVGESLWGDFECNRDITSTMC
jgi:hypothetical protein